jgi:hypothetical protein
MPRFVDNPGESPHDCSASTCVEDRDAILKPSLRLKQSTDEVRLVRLRHRVGLHDGIKQTKIRTFQPDDTCAKNQNAYLGAVDKSQAGRVEEAICR